MFVLCVCCILHLYLSCICSLFFFCFSLSFSSSGSSAFLTLSVVSSYVSSSNSCVLLFMKCLSHASVFPHCPVSFTRVAACYSARHPSAGSHPRDIYYCSCLYKVRNNNDEQQHVFFHIYIYIYISIYRYTYILMNTSSSRLRLACRAVHGELPQDAQGVLKDGHAGRCFSL